MKMKRIDVSQGRAPTSKRAMTRMPALLLLLVGVFDGETARWNLEIRRVETPWTYVEEGGAGEKLQLVLTASSSTPVQPRWVDPNSIPVTVRIGSENLPDLEFSQTLVQTGMQAGVDRSTWSFSLSVSRLQQLKEQWGFLPPKISISAVMDEAGVPAVTSSKVPVVLKAVPKREATWSQLLSSLRSGQPREEVEALLGFPMKERLFHRGNGPALWRWVYPNPDAPRDLPVEARVSEVYLDLQGNFLFSNFYGGC